MDRLSRSRGDGNVPYVINEDVAVLLRVYSALLVGMLL
jgi:hypothetical protein